MQNRNPRDRLIWRKTEHGFSLHHSSSSEPLVGIERDAKWSGLYRVRLSDGSLSHMINLTRAKNAARLIVLKVLNSRPQEWAAEGAWVRKSWSVRGGECSDSERGSDHSHDSLATRS
jgi:hypothetical protein